MGLRGLVVLDQMGLPQLLAVGQGDGEELTEGAEPVNPLAVHPRRGDGTVVGAVVSDVGVGESIAPQLGTGRGVEGAQIVGVTIGELGQDLAVRHHDGGITRAQIDLPADLQRRGLAAEKLRVDGAVVVRATKAGPRRRRQGPARYEKNESRCPSRHRPSVF